MSNLEWSKGRKRMIEEQAKTELENLHLLHPDRFDYLKLELKSFIHLLQSQSQSQSQHFSNADEASISRSSTTLAPDSQESSSCKKRRIEKETKGDEFVREITVSEMRENNRVNVVMERAVVCLRKIRRFKTALFPGD